MQAWQAYQAEAAELFRSLGCKVEVDATVEGARARHLVDVFWPDVAARISDLTWAAHRPIGFGVASTQPGQERLHFRHAGPSSDSRPLSSGSDNAFGRCSQCGGVRGKSAGGSVPMVKGHAHPWGATSIPTKTSLPRTSHVRRICVRPEVNSSGPVITRPASDR
jgi:hypothetical protein